MKGVIFNLLESLGIDRFGDEIMESICTKQGPDKVGFRPYSSVKILLLI